MLTVFEKNLHFLNATYEKVSLPKEISFLYKYFSTHQQRAFVHYYYVMGDWKHFSEHTGIPASRYFKLKLSYKYKYFLSEYEKAKSCMDFDTLKKLNSRKIILNSKLR